MICPLAILALYGALWLWSSWEMRQRDKAGHRCTCFQHPAGYCFYCGD